MAVQILHQHVVCSLFDNVYYRDTIKAGILQTQRVYVIAGYVLNLKMLWRARALVQQEKELFGYF